MSYISREAAIEFIDAGHLVSGNEPRWSDNEVVNFLKSRPAADVVEVVRCKDCENYQTDWQPLSFDDGHYCAMVDTIMPYDGFCYMGERREDG